MIPFERIETKAESLLKKADAFFTPTNLIQILEYLGLKLDERPLEDEYSGLLILGKKPAVVVINSRHSKARKRFTIAHEVGHYVLHKSVEKETYPVFVDKVKVYFRNNNDEGEYYDHGKEMEANAFAAEILMPKRLLKEYIEENDLDISKKSGIKTLATEFEVSQQAMEYRLKNTGLIMDMS